MDLLQFFPGAQPVCRGQNRNVYHARLVPYMSETADCFGRQLGSSPAGIYHVSMTSFRISVTVLAVIHAVFAGFTALVGAFANGGDVWQRLLVVLLHPLGAAGLLLLVLRPRLATTKILAMMALLTANVMDAPWELALAFSNYAFALLRTARKGQVSPTCLAEARCADAAPLPREREFHRVRLCSPNVDFDVRRELARGNR